MVAPYTRKPIFHRGTSTQAPSYWRGSRATGTVPATAILTEDGDPILTEDGDYILTEA